MALPCDELAANFPSVSCQHTPHVYFANQNVVKSRYFCCIFTCFQGVWRKEKKGVKNSIKNDLVTWQIKVKDLQYLSLVM